MKVCRSNYLEIVKIIPFSERRTCFCEFAKQYGFEIKKDFFKSANEIMFKHIERSLFA